MSDHLLCAAFSVPATDGFPLRGDARWRAGADPAAPRPAVVISHGFKGFKDWGFFPELARGLADAGYLAISFNTSGSGIGEVADRFDEVERFERATLGGDLDDLGRILDALLAGRLPGPTAPEPVALLGHSRGGGISLIRAAEDARIGCVVTWAGVGTFERFEAHEIRAWRERGYHEITNARTGQVFRLHTALLDDLERQRARFDLVRVVRRFRVPLLMVHGVDDETVPIAEAEELLAWAPPRASRLEAIRGTGHTFGAVHPFTGMTPALRTALGVTVEFLGEHLAV